MKYQGSCLLKIVHQHGMEYTKPEAGVVFFYGCTPAYVSSQARNWIWDAALAMLGHLTHFAKLGIEPATLQWTEPLQSDS